MLNIYDIYISLEPIHPTGCKVTLPLNKYRNASYVDIVSYSQIQYRYELFAYIVRQLL